MMRKIKSRYAGKRMSTILLMILMATCFLSGCVDQHPEGTRTDVQPTETLESMLKITDPVEKEAVEIAKAKVHSMGTEPRIIATSPAVAEICDRLELDLVGVCTSSSSSIPERYEEVTQVGAAMSPDMEIVSSLSPDWILSPSSLQSDLQPKYEAIDTDWAFLNLRSVQGMYRSIQELGEIFDREEQAETQIKEFKDFYETYQKEQEGKTHPRVLILMGLPGSYIIATENSYVGSLVALAGGENVYEGSTEEFLTVNTEDMKNKEPDIILRTAHALPDQVMEMFNEDFATNDIWKHFSAVKNNQVYDLTYEYFGMSANFSYPDALQELQEILYPDGEKKNSKKSSDKKKKDSDKSTDKSQKNNDKATDEDNDKTTDKKQEG